MTTVDLNGLPWTTATDSVEVCWSVRLPQTGPQIASSWTPRHWQYQLVTEPGRYSRYL